MQNEAFKYYGNAMNEVVLAELNTFVHLDCHIVTL